MVKLYVEGGGDASTLKSECRRGFNEFLRKAGLDGRMPRIVACGSRQNAFDSFCTAVKNNEDAFLLVDSEIVVNPCYQQGEPKDWQPWQHLFERDSWQKPTPAQDIHCHLMTQVMEAWFLADRESLAHFFGSGFQETKLPAVARPIETIDKNTLYSSIQKATAHCKSKACYGKGLHSFKILALLTPSKVIECCPWAKRLVDTLLESL